MAVNLRRRALLSKAVYWMLVLLVLAFVFVLFRSLDTGLTALPSTEKSLKDDSLFSDIVPGQTALRRVGSLRIWVTRFSDAQRLQAAQLSSLVKTGGLHCKPESDLCVIAASTNRQGVELRYTRSAPVQLPSGLQWFGGFVDPSNGRLYDLWGRAYAFQNVQSLNEQLIKP